VILTLRTLLSWLDDTATLAESEEIGKLVEANSSVLELVGRIYEGMHSDPCEEPIDDDLVSSYLDNQLDPAACATFETLCLESDALLASVTDTHRILSFIGKRVKGPPESKPRMYQLGPP
jgi:hypothetical protein